MPKTVPRSAAPPPSSFFARMWSRRSVRRLVIVFGVLLLLGLGIYMVEDIRGELAWQKHKQEQEAKGEKLEWKAFIPPAVPDDENFAMTPFLSALFDVKAPQNSQSPAPKFDTSELASRVAGTWTKSQFLNFKVRAKNERRDEDFVAESATDRVADAGEVLRTMEKFEPITSELEIASHRPYARYNIHYENKDVTTIDLPHLPLFKSLEVLFEAKASAELALRQPANALRDTRMAIYLANTLTNEPFLLSGLVRIAMLNLALQPLWEGLATHQWSDAQLVEVEQTLGHLDLLREYLDAMRGERAFGIAGLENLRKGGSRAKNKTDVSASPGIISMPSGWFYENEIAVDRMVQSGLFPSVDVAMHRVYPTLFAKNQVRTSEELSSGFVPHKIFAAIIFPSIVKVQSKYARLQSYVDEALVAIALERFHLAHEDYPASLDALSPQFITHVPIDMIGGDSLKYHAADKNHFVLYSIGWNEKDDDGSVAILKDSKTFSLDPTEGDWVWPLYP